MAGAFDLRTVDDLKAGFVFAERQARHVILDITDVEIIDCSSLGLVVRAQQDARRRGRTLVLAAPSPLVTRILQATGLYPAIPVFRTRELARASLLVEQSGGLQGATAESTHDERTGGKRFCRAESTVF